MRNYFTLGGVDSRDFNTYIATSNAFDSAERDVETVEVPGRNGDLTISHDRFKNFQAQVTVYIPSGMQRNTGALAAMLLSQTGYRRYEEAIRPGLFRMARYAGPFEVSVSDHHVAGLTLNLDCMPQRFLTVGENTTEYTSTGILENPTLYPSKPLIRIYGVGSVTLNGSTIRVTAAPSKGYTDIDCESMDAYCGTENRNSYVTFSRDWVEAAAGTNSVILNGVTKAEITPRWWTI